MKKAILRNICQPFVLCIAMMFLLIYLPMTCYGQDTPCPMGMEVDVSPYQVNIDSGGVEHYVRILTYSWYRNASEVYVYINENEEAIKDNYIILTRDSVGHLVVKIELVALQDAKLRPDTIHSIKIAVVLKEAIDNCSELEGEGEIYIVGKNGDEDSGSQP